MKTKIYLFTSLFTLINIFIFSQTPTGTGFPTPTTTELPTSPIIFEEHLLSDSTRTWSLCAADLNKDNNIDVVSVSMEDDMIQWMENSGGNAPSFTTRTITHSLQQPKSVKTADINGDGNIDILACGGDKLVWLENNGESITLFSEHIIDNYSAWYSSLYPADLDNDNDIDIIATTSGENRIIWYENDGNTHPSFTLHILLSREVTSTADFEYCVYSADLDNDNDMDVIYGAYYRGEVAWFENNGDLEKTFTAHEITTSIGSVTSVYASDINGDGNIDIISSGYTSGIYWYENDDNIDPAFIIHEITTTLYGLTSSITSDLDLDEDIDIISVSTDDMVLWFENNGGQSPDFSEYIIPSNCNTPYSVFAADLDNDGDSDIISGSIHSAIMWYENKNIDISPTPTPTPTPHWIVYDFEGDDDGWTTGGAEMQFPLPLYRCDSGSLQLESTDYNQYGFWESPRDDIPYIENSIYKSTFTVKSNIADKTIQPSFRIQMRMQNESVGILSMYNSFMNAGDMPDADGEDYVLFFDPMDQTEYQEGTYSGDFEIMDDLFLEFDIVNFYEDQLNSIFYLENVIVDRFDKSALPTPTTVKTFDTTEDFANWTRDGAPAFYLMPEFTDGDGSITMTTTDDITTTTYGYVESSRTANEVDIEADKLYRTLFTVSSTTPQDANAIVRLRVGTESNQLSHLVTILSRDSGANEPTSSGTVYETLVIPPQSDIANTAETNGLVFACDIINFEPANAMNANLTLEKVEVQTIDLGLLP